MRLVRRAWLPWRINISAFHPFRWIFGGQEKDRAGGSKEPQNTHHCRCRVQSTQLTAFLWMSLAREREAGRTAGEWFHCRARSRLDGAGAGAVRPCPCSVLACVSGPLGGVLWGFQREQSAAADCDTAYLMQYDFCRACQWAGRPTIKPGCREKDPDPFQRQGGTLR